MIEWANERLAESKTQRKRFIRKVQVFNQIYLAWLWKHFYQKLIINHTISHSSLTRSLPLFHFLFSSIWTFRCVCFSLVGFSTLTQLFLEISRIWRECEWRLLWYCMFLRRWNNKMNRWINDNVFPLILQLYRIKSRRLGTIKSFAQTHDSNFEPSALVASVKIQKPQNRWTQWKWKLGMLNFY